MHQVRCLSIWLLLMCVVPAAVSQDKGKPQQLDPFREIEPEHAKVDVPSLIHVRTSDDVKRVRKELVAFIWKNHGELPTESHVEREEEELPKELQAVQATCEKWTVLMKEGFSSVVFHFQPREPGRKLAIFHQGHTVLWDAGSVETVQHFLKKGYGVLAVQMPLFGDNKRLAPPKIKSHNDMAELISRELEPIRFFVEPVLVSLNFAIKKYGYDDVVMTGLSGGGWTTTLYAAIDPRVRISIPVAGTQPAHLRTGSFHGGRDRGDWEQYYEPLYKIANYLDLYVLGASGPGRAQRQVLNQFDSCCFAGVRYRTYEKHVQAAVKSTGSGAFEVFLDDTHRGHLISQHAWEKAFLPVLEKGK